MTTKSDQNQSSEHEQHKKHERKTYLIFAAMITTSTVTMFLLTYTNAFTWSHMTFSEERAYMALLMGSAMTIIMLGFVWGMMDKNVKVNVVQDEAYIEGMIPHHSIAILTSEGSEIEDVRVRRLADGIIEAQRIEIAEIKLLIEDIEKNGAATTEEDAKQCPVPDFEASPWARISSIVSQSASQPVATI